MAQANLTKKKTMSAKIVARTPRLGLLAVSLCLLPACALVQPTNATKLSNTVKTADQNTHYKFESKNPIFANLGRYDGSLNSTYMQNRNAMAARPIKEDARSRFAPQPLTYKSSGGTSLNSFLKTYGAAPQTALTKPRSNGLKAYDFSKFDQFGFKNPAPMMNPSDNADIAFVNVNGKTDAQDWDTCAREHQGVFDQNVAGFKLKKSFEVCMRQRGYQPEDEAVETLMAQPSGVSPAVERADEMPIATYPSLKGFSRMDTQSEKEIMNTRPREYSDVLAGGY